MRYILLPAMLALSACNGVPSPAPSSPAVIADQTILDEKALTGLELAYKAARIAVETGVDAGLIKGQTAVRFAELDNKAYAALGAARRAYEAGNSQSYGSAIVLANSAITDLLSLTGKGN